MSRTVTAIFENGIIRPLQPVDLDNGEEVEVILLKKGEPSPVEASTILSDIADLPLEGDSDAFSGADHDDILYPKVG